MKETGGDAFPASRQEMPEEARTVRETEGAGIGSGRKYAHVLFKGRRVDLYDNPDSVPLYRWQHVVVEVERGEDIGQILSPDGPDFRRRKDLEIRRVLRAASAEEMRELARLRAEEDPAALRKAKERVAFFGLPMHVLDAEHQADGHRVTFYFTADHRIDFRRLVRDLAAIFRMRIELRQIGTREAARRMGGLGTCGRELCCCCMLCDFERVTLQMAREQRLVVNPARLSGVCGRLLCCLNFEEAEGLPPGLDACPHGGRRDSQEGEDPDQLQDIEQAEGV